MAKDKDYDDNDDASELEFSSLETHFVEREDDNETLWEVLEIVAEKKTQYRVRWAGVNPATGKPWPLDWVPKKDCTPPLVATWKRRKAEKKEEEANSRRKSAGGSRTSMSSMVSAASSATVTRSTASGSSRSLLATAGTKRKNDERFQSPELAVEDGISSMRPRKKRKVMSETSFASTSKVQLNLQKEEEEPTDDERKPATVKSNKQMIKNLTVIQDSDADEEPPKAMLSKGKLVKSISKLTRPVSQTTSRSGAVQHDSTDGEDTTTIRRSGKLRSNASKEPKPEFSSESSDDSLPPPPPPKRRPARAASGSARVSNPRSSTSARAIKRPASLSSSPSPLPSPSLVAHPSPADPSPHSSTTSTPVPLPKATRSGVLQNGSSHPAERDDGHDSALEYADYPAPPSTPPPGQAQAQTKPSLFLQSATPSPTPSPPPSPRSALRTSKSLTAEAGKGAGAELVPETETEESQESQHQSLAPALTVPEPTPSASEQKLHTPSTDAAQLSPAMLSRSDSFVGRMKPRTPGSRRHIPDTDVLESPHPFPNGTSPASPAPRAKKTLHAIPQISPSKFSALPSTIESTDTRDGDGIDDDTIEQFDSPDKPAAGRAKQGEASQEVPESSNGSGGTSGGSLPVPPAATDVLKKGVAMAERARLNGSENGGVNGVLLTQVQAKVTLVSLVEKGKGKKEAPRDSGVDTDEEEETEQSTLEEFADSFVDYEGGLGEDRRGQARDASSRTEGTSRGAASVQQQKVTLRQEEEESTQDLLLVLGQQRPVPDVDEGWAHPVIPHAESSQQQHQSGDEETADVINSLDVAPPKSSGPILETQTPQDEASQPQVASQPSPEKLPPSSRSLDHSFEIPATISPAHPLVPRLSFSSSQTQDGTNQNLDSAMTLLNKKSEEISRLEALVQDLQTSNATLKASSFSHEAEKASLLAAVESVNKRAGQAEKDVNFFRDLYGTQSAFVGELQAENKDLSSRAEIAEGQVQHGLDGIRATFELRIKQLEGEVEYHRRIVTFVMEQAHRTQDEEIRRRAAEHPEMERRVRELEAEMRELDARLEGAREMIDMFEKQLTSKDKDNEELRGEKRKLEEEEVCVRREIEQLKVLVERLRGARVRKDGGRNEDDDRGEVEVEVESGVSVSADEVVNNVASDVAVVGAQEHVTVPGGVPVYRCRWQKDGKEHCDAMFFTKEELQRHIELGGHLE